MEKELVRKLDEIRNELEISLEDFIDIMAIAEDHANKSIVNISDELLYEIILSSLMEYDYESTYLNGRKRIKETVNRAINTMGIYFEPVYDDEIMNVGKTY